MKKVTTYQTSLTASEQFQMGNMTMEEVKEHAAELDEKIDAYLGI